MEIIGYTVAGILSFFALYGFVLVLAGSFHSHPSRGASTLLPPIKVLLPAYKPDRVFLEVLERLQSAIKDHPVEVLILFQRAKEEIVEASEKFGFETIQKHFDHLPGNSYRHALQYLCKEHLDASKHRYTVIFDKDNLVDGAFFDRLAQADLTQYDIVQGMRRPIELAGEIQLFDAISERYNDLMLRKGKCQLGGVLEVSGSAALVATPLFQDAIESMDENAPGYDKNFMVKLLTYPQKLKTQFAEDLLVYEEKTDAIENYRSQRLRWFGEQYFNALFNAKALIASAFVRGKWRSLDYWITLIRPPRSLQLVLSAFLMGIDWLDEAVGFLSLPFLLNAISFLVVSWPIITGKHGWKLMTGAYKVVVSNLVTSVSSLKKKYQNVFIHTR